MVAVDGVECPAAPGEDGILRQNGEVQHHLIHLSVTVSPDAQQMLPAAVEQLDDLLGGIALRQVVPGTVVQKISQQQKPLPALLLEALQQQLAVPGGAVEVGGDHQLFHLVFSFPAAFCQRRSQRLYQ